MTLRTHCSCAEPRNRQSLIAIQRPDAVVEATLTSRPQVRQSVINKRQPHESLATRQLIGMGAGGMSRLNTSTSRHSFWAFLQTLPVYVEDIAPAFPYGKALIRFLDGAH